MKLKMAPNSVFAVLLRSPWWMSFVLVAAILLASNALLPERYVVFGGMAAFPFLVVAVVAAFRQYKRLSPAQVERTLQMVAAMSRRDFCHVLEQAYRQQGYVVTRADDEGSDLLVAKAGRSSVIACKRWKAAIHGVEPLRMLNDSRRARDASHGIYVSIAEVGDKTRQYAKQNQIDLLHGAALAQLLGALQVPGKP